MNKLVLRLGDTGPLVAQLQELLATHKFQGHHNQIKVDGEFGPRTEEYVKVFQKNKGLKPDGVVGPMTWRMLNFNPSELFADTDVATSSTWIETHLLPDDEYVKQETPKQWIFLHHTAGRHNPKATIDQWAADSRGRIGTHYVIGGIPSNVDADNLTKKDKEWDGRILRAIEDKYWGYHLGAVKSSKMHKNSISIEICSAGSLTEKNGKFYTWYNQEVHPSQVARLGNSYKGVKYYHKYSEAQIKALKALLYLIADTHSIDLNTGVVAELKKNPNDPNFLAFNYSEKACTGNIVGVLTHGQVRKDKSDVFPQKELIEMLISL
jgi:N-acetyl-anhydromuramyl-L-alanine amidase AmpD